MGDRTVPTVDLSFRLQGQANRDALATQYIRRTVRIREKEVVGYGLDVSRLTAEASILLQEHGLGGRRPFGCGVFVPGR
jgi:CRISPR-associated protein Cas6